LHVDESRAQLLLITTYDAARPQGSGADGLLPQGNEYKAAARLPDFELLG
jgi:hypothetical protein